MTQQNDSTAGGGAAGSNPPLDASPVVYERKKKYSKNLKSAQRIDDDVARAASRFARAVADGVDEYRRSKDKSARKKRDGAIKDLARNVSRGLEEALSTGAKVPTDLTRSLSMRRLRRLFVPPPFIFLK